MKKVRLFALTTVCLVIIGLWISVPREPSYKGKLLSYWLNGIKHAGSVDNTKEAVEAIKAMNERALPFLLKEIGYETPLQKVFNRVASQLGFHAIGPTRTRGLDFPVVFAFYHLRNQAESVVPQLVHMAEKEFYVQNALMALYFLGPSGVPPLGQLCASMNANASVGAVGFWTMAKETNLEKVEWKWSSNGLNQINFPGHVRPEAMAKNLTNSTESIRRASLNWFKDQMIRNRFYTREEILEAINRVDPKAAMEAGFK